MHAIGQVEAPLAFLNAGPFEMILLAIVALMLFGGDLPEVARTWGKYFGEFRKHVNGIREELNAAIYAEGDSPRRLSYYPERYTVEAASTASKSIEPLPALPLGDADASPDDDASRSPSA